MQSSLHRSFSSLPTGTAAPTLPLGVLLLDDSEFDRRRVTRLLAQLDFTVEVVEAECTRDLPEILDWRPFDIVLLDYRLPEGDGSDAVALVRHHRLNHGCRAIMITGDDTLDAGGRVMHDKCDAYLCKSHLTPESLRRILLHSGDPAATEAEWSARHDPDIGVTDLSDFRETTEAGFSTGVVAEPDRPDRALTETGLRDALGDLEQIINGLHNLRHLPRGTPAYASPSLAQIEQCAIRRWAALHKVLEPDAPGADPLKLVPPGRKH